MNHIYIQPHEVIGEAKKIHTNSSSVSQGITFSVQFALVRY